MKSKRYVQMLRHECERCGKVILSHCVAESCCREIMKAKVAAGEPDPRD